MNWKIKLSLGFLFSSLLLSPAWLWAEEDKPGCVSDADGKCTDPKGDVLEDIQAGAASRPLSTSCINLPDSKLAVCKSNVPAINLHDYTKTGKGGQTPQVADPALKESGSAN